MQLRDLLAIEEKIWINVLDLSRNHLTQKGLAAVLEAIRNALGSGPRVVKAFRNQIASIETEHILHGLLENCRLEELHLSHNLLQFPDMRRLIDTVLAAKDAGAGRPLYPLAKRIPLWLRLEYNPGMTPGNADVFAQYLFDTPDKDLICLVDGSYKCIPGRCRRPAHHLCAPAIHVYHFGIAQPSTSSQKQTTPATSPATYSTKRKPISNVICPGGNDIEDCEWKNEASHARSIAWSLRATAVHANLDADFPPLVKASQSAGKRKASLLLERKPMTNKQPPSPARKPPSHQRPACLPACKPSMDQAPGLEPPPRLDVAIGLQQTAATTLPALANIYLQLRAKEPYIAERDGYLSVAEGEQISLLSLPAAGEGQDVWKSYVFVALAINGEERGWVPSDICTPATPWIYPIKAYNATVDGYLSVRPADFLQVLSLPRAGERGRDEFPFYVYVKESTSGAMGWVPGEVCCLASLLPGDQIV